MKKEILLVVVLTFVFLLSGCSHTKEVKKQIEKSLISNNEGEILENANDLEYEQSQQSQQQKQQQYFLPPPQQVQQSAQVGNSIFFTYEDISFSFYWPNSQSSGHIGLSDDEVDILVKNKNDGKELEITSVSFSYFVDSKEYKPQSGSVETYKLNDLNWNRINYKIVDNGASVSVILKPQEKSRIHYHMGFDPKLSTSQKQTTKIKISFRYKDTVQAIDKELTRI